MPPSRRATLGALAATGIATALQARGARAAAPPLRVGVAGLVHGHIHGFVQGLAARGDLTLVGVAEPDEALARATMARHRLPNLPTYRTVAALLEAGRPEAVLAFTNTYDHPAVVAACAARGVHVMMEKPLAVSVAHGRAIAEAARRGRIHVLVNYETTWYPSHRALHRLVKGERAIGAIRKVVVRDGHRGPKEIGVGPEFLRWLVDPKLNGAGALYDFGCYGANLMTWLMDGARPLTVSAVTQTMKPEIYRHVDDEATVVLTYPGAQAILQASWNWPFARKDLEVHGETGHAFALSRDEARARLAGRAETPLPAPPIPGAEADPLSLLVAVVRGALAPREADLSSLANNLIVTEILEAARTSARTGRVVRLASR